MRVKGPDQAEGKGILVDVLDSADLGLETGSNPKLWAGRSERGGVIA